MGYPEEAPSAFAFETLTIDNTAAGIGPTAATIQPSNAPAARRAVFGPLETAQIRYRYDGTAPTATVGHLLEIGDVLILEGIENIRNFKGIRTGGANGSLPSTYER